MTGATVCVIDDDELVLAIAKQILETRGFRVLTFASADQFLVNFDETAVHCVVTDLRMPHMDGAELQRFLRSQGSLVSLVVVTGHADVSTAVRLMEEGALTLLEKPYRPPELLNAVERGIARTQQRRREAETSQHAQVQLAQLTEEEAEVLDQVLSGAPNKAIAARMNISRRTVDRRRHSLLEKIGVRTISELATMVAQARGTVGRNA